MFGKGCPATGRMAHRFDPETHRCKCGRWERGFAPKKACVKPRAECQICERKQACDADGTLGHHGYKRPGWGFIQGDCMGEGHQPYPATDALEKYLRAVEGYIVRCQEALVNLRTIAELPYSFDDWRSRVKKTITVMVKRGAEARYEQEYRRAIPFFEELEVRERQHTESEIAHAESEKTRVENRIKNAGN